MSHRSGTITARIKKMTTIFNTTDSQGNVASTLHLGQGLGTQKLVLFFDEIQALNGVLNSLLAIEVSQGTGVFIGRRVYSEIPDTTAGGAIQIGGGSTKGYIKINEIISKNSVALVLNDFNDEITIDANYIEGNAGAVVYSSGTSSNAGNYVLKNSKIKNKSSSSTARGIYLENIYPKVTLNNIKIVSNDEIIYLNSGSSIDVKNYGLFGKHDIGANVHLKIGPELNDPNYNYLFIVDSLLT